MFASFSFHLVPLWQAPGTAVGRVGGSAEGGQAHPSAAGSGAGARASALQMWLRGRESVLHPAANSLSAAGGATLPLGP